VPADAIHFGYATHVVAPNHLVATRTAATHLCWAKHVEPPTRQETGIAAPGSMGVVTHFEMVPSMEHDWIWMRSCGTGWTAGEICHDLPVLSASGGTATVTEALWGRGAWEQREWERVKGSKVDLRSRAGPNSAK